MWSLAGFIAFRLRLPDPWRDNMLTSLYYVLGSLPIRVVLIPVFSLFRQSWSRVGVRDLIHIGQAVGTGVVVLTVLSLLIRSVFVTPLSVPFIEGVFALSFLGAARLLIRLWFERGKALSSPGGVRRVLVIGAGEAGTMITRELLRHRETGLRPIGFLDDAVGKQGRRYVGLPVLGRITDLARVVKATRVEEVLIAIPSASGIVVRRIVGLARAAGVRYQIIPGVYEILRGSVSVSNIRKVDVEDLLRRPPVKLNQEQIATYLQGKVIMVTGAGGSIGSELVFQCARFNPEHVVLVGRGEYSLYSLERRIERRCPDLSYTAVIGDMQNRSKLEHLFGRFHPDVVLHTAAHKHVPMMEINPDEAVANNVRGTGNLVDMALEYGTRRFVNISTDKAVNPTSILGACKRVAEYLVRRAADRAGPDQIMVSVRFGNVLDSRGSVVPLFREQIAHGGPVTVTHPEMIRYFMTVEEAAQLVLQAAGMDENGVIYILDMGEPVRIADLAADLIRLSGLEPNVDVDITYSGIRPGEKLFEELLTDEEGVQASYHEKIFIAPKNGIEDCERCDVLIRDILQAADARDHEAVRRILKELVPSYHTLEIN